MKNSNEISVSEAAKWLLKIASTNGPITPEVMQIIDDFAKEYGLELHTLIPELNEFAPKISELNESAPKPIRTKQDLFRELRDNENRKLERQIKNPAGCDFLKERIEIELPDKTHISEPTNKATLRLIFDKLGFQRVADANVKFEGKYPLVTRNTKSARYYKDGSWYILSNITTKGAAICLNQVFDELNVCMIARVITR